MKVLRTVAMLVLLAVALWLAFTALGYSYAVVLLIENEFFYRPFGWLVVFGGFGAVVGALVLAVVLANQRQRRRTASS